jgi:hypothetical protein
MNRQSESNRVSSRAERSNEQDDDGSDGAHEGMLAGTLRGDKRKTGKGDGCELNLKPPKRCQPALSSLVVSKVRDWDFLRSSHD